MIFLRSILFNPAFYLNLIVQMIVITPVLFLLPHKKAYGIAKNWARSNHWLFDKIVGTTFEIEGLENIPKGRATSSRRSTSPSGTPMRCCPWHRRRLLHPQARADGSRSSAGTSSSSAWFPVDRGARGRVMAAVIARVQGRNAAAGAS
jgi:1-acyl-sn-glycerol-3-phosphate acyltransferase